MVTIAAALYSTTAVASQLTYYGFDNPRGALTHSSAARNQFLATLSSYGIETFESVPTFVANPNLSFPGTDITATTQTSFVFAFPPYPVSGTRALTDKGPGKLDGDPFDDVFQFSQPVTAFGSYFVNVGDALENTVTLVLENSVLGTSKEIVLPTHAPPNIAVDSTFFFGVTDSDPFDRVILKESKDFDGIILDDMIVGYVREVPEPGTITLATVAALVLGLAYRRMHRAD